MSNIVFGAAASLVLFILAAFIITVNFVFIKVKVSGSSMVPTLRSGDVVMVNVYAAPDYGDVIIISGEKANGDWLIKRAIAFGGDAVKIEGGKVYLKKAGGTDFELLAEPYLAAGVTTPTNVQTKDTSSRIWEIDEGNIFYLGDNRGNSSDSRSDYGTCEESQVIGVVSDFALKVKGVNNFFDGVSVRINALFG